MMKKTTISKTMSYAPVEKVVNRLSKTSRTPKPPVLHRLVRDMTSEAYHGCQGTWSSSQLKDIIDDEEIFIKKYIKKEVPREDRESFGTGTYFHTKVLEPHKVATEIAIFQGKTRYGKAWDEFKAKSADKTVITEKQKSEGDAMAEAVHNSPICSEYIEGDPEISLFTKLVVAYGNIYAPEFKKVLTPNGWESYKGSSIKGFEIIIKVRADCLGEGFVSDLKSTSGRANNAHSVRGSISKYKYDLSAALYLDMFSLVKDVDSFIWIFASKENPIATSWIATENQIKVGRAKWSWALKRIADLAQANWEIVDYLREAEPLQHELEWLKQRDIDLL